MKFSLAAAAAALLAPLAAAQNYIDCNPMQKDCPPNPALGKSVHYDMKSHPEGFKVIGKEPSYTPNGADFVIAKPGDNPTIMSDFYIMYGRVEINMKSAKGKGIVSSAFLLSDVGDELDIEFLGDQELVEFNWFRKGDTSNPQARVYKHPVPGHWDTYNTYSMDWTPERVEWAINGDVIRTWTAQEAGANFVQTPMAWRVGPWAGGDFERNPEGTAEWAHGPVDYSQLPFTMSVNWMKVTDYSTGKEYVYTDRSGNKESIKAVDGEIFGNPGGSPPEEVESPTPPPEEEPEPTPSSPTEGMPEPAPAPSKSLEPPTTLTTEVSVTSLPGLPSSWVISSSDSGTASDPSSAATTSPSTSSSAPSSSSDSSPESTTAETGPSETGQVPTTLIPIVTPSGPPTSVPTAPDAGSAGSALSVKSAFGAAVCMFFGIALL